MPKQLNNSISTAVNTPLSEVVHGLFNYGIDGDIISGGMLGNTNPDVYAESAAALATIGTRLRMKDGREFIYCRNGAAEIGIAKMGQAEAPTGNWNEVAQASHGWSVGDTSGSIVLTGTAPAVNEFAEGWMVVNKGTGIGQCYRISTNTSHATLPSISLYDPIITAFPEGSEVTIIKSNFADTIVVATGGLTAVAVGVPLITVTACYYYWSQVKGPAPLIVDTDETVIIGLPVTCPATCAVAGTCGPAVTLENHYGHCMFVAAAAEPAVVNLDLGI